MDDKVAALLGAAAVLTVGGRRLRPVAKVAMKGVVAAGDATTDVRREIAQLYNEARAERREAQPLPGDGQEPAG